MACFCVKWSTLKITFQTVEMLKAVEHDCGVLDDVGENNCEKNLFEESAREKKYCAETLVGTVFQRGLKNKF